MTQLFLPWMAHESGIKKSLDVLEKWCRDWGVKINVSKSGIMHVRQKRVARTDVQYVIDNEERT